MMKYYRGGHGRTGTIISIMIGILFNLNSMIMDINFINKYIYLNM